MRNKDGYLAQDNPVLFFGETDEYHTMYSYELDGEVIDESYVCFSSVLRKLEHNKEYGISWIRVVVVDEDGEIAKYYAGDWGGDVDVQNYLCYDNLNWWVGILNTSKEFSKHGIDFVLVKDEYGCLCIDVKSTSGEFKDGSVVGLALHLARLPRIIGMGVHVIRKMVEGGIPFRSAYRMYLQFPYMVEANAVGVSTDEDNNLPLGASWNLSPHRPTEIDGVYSLTEDLVNCKTVWNASSSIKRIKNKSLDIHEHHTGYDDYLYFNDNPSAYWLLTMSHGGTLVGMLEGYHEDVSFEDYLKLTKELMEYEG